MIVIHRASPDDAERLTQITVTSKRYWNYPEKWIQLWLPQLTLSSFYILENEVWLASMKEAPVGYYSLIHDLNDLWLENLWVLPEYMEQGIGRQLFCHALERSRMLGFSNLKIEADPNAQGFYERMGANKAGEHRYELDGHQRVLPIMEINGFEGL
jgi:ribosomal protein S18 acetylase RimI-like enzyme